MKESTHPEVLEKIGRLADFELIERLLAHHLMHPKRRPDTAIGYEGAVTLWALLEHFAPASRDPFRVVDCGSGFSTLVIRAWAKMYRARGFEVSCVTTDHDPGWLARTYGEIVELDFPSGHFYEHNANGFYRVAPRLNLFDFMFIDLGKTPLRIAEFPRYEPLLRVGGLMLLDDWHMPHYREPMTEVLHGAGYDISPIPNSTDRFGRFMALAQRST